MTSPPALVGAKANAQPPDRAVGSATSALKFRVYDVYGMLIEANAKAESLTGYGEEAGRQNCSRGGEGVWGGLGGRGGATGAS